MPSVWIIDDLPVLATAVGRVVGSWGYQTRVFFEPQEPISLILVMEDPPEVVITDFDMPGLSGVDFARALRRLDQPPRCVLVSGSIIRPFLHEDLFDLVMEKPLDYARLRAALGEFTGHRE